MVGGGPLPGNHTMALEEAKCAAAEKNPPWYPTVNPAELQDSNRTHVYACAQFGGSFTDPNRVFAYASPAQYYSPIFGVTRGVNERTVCPRWIMGQCYSKAFRTIRSQTQCRRSNSAVAHRSGQLERDHISDWCVELYRGSQCACRWQPRSRRRQQLVQDEWHFWSCRGGTCLAYHITQTLTVWQIGPMVHSS